VAIIRKFKPTDMFSIIKIASETLPERYSPSLFNYFYETSPDGFIVAEKNRKIVGFIIGVTTNPEEAKILMLGVYKHNRRQKIGTNLLQQFMDEIKKQKIRNIELEVRTDNSSAIKFYEKHGFKIKEKIPNFYQNQEDAFNMKRTL